MANDRTVSRNPQVRLKRVGTLVESSAEGEQGVLGSGGGGAAVGDDEGSAALEDGAHTGASASAIHAVERLTAEGAVVLGVLSDTHGWLDPALLEHFAGVAAIVHAGDVGRPEVLEALGVIAPVHAVRGNIDGGALADLPEEIAPTWAALTVAIRHICGSPHRPARAAERLILSSGADVLVFGHSHVPVAVRRGGCLWLNPGAAGNEGFHYDRTAALLAIGPQGGVRVMRIHLGPRGRRASG